MICGAWNVVGTATASGMTSLQNQLPVVQVPARCICDRTELVGRQQVEDICRRMVVLGYVLPDVREWRDSQAVPALRTALTPGSLAARMPAAVAGPGAVVSTALRADRPLP